MDSVDDVATIQLDAPRVSRPTDTIDLAFVLDVTGSMSAEIEAMKDTIDAVARDIVAEGEAEVRLRADPKNKLTGNSSSDLDT